MSQLQVKSDGMQRKAKVNKRTKIGYCNSLLLGLPKRLLKRLQFVLNSAARFISMKKKHDHITETLIELHWLLLTSL